MDVITLLADTNKYDRNEYFHIIQNIRIIIESCRKRELIY